MQADMDDLPDYLRTKKQNPWRLVTILGIGSAIAILGMVIFVQPIVIDIASLKRAVRVGGMPIFERTAQAFLQQPAMPIYQQLETIQPQSTIRQDQASRLQDRSTSERQTDFNDLNYTPKGAANVVTFKEVPIQNELEPEKQASMVTIVGDSNAKRDSCWMHENGSIAKRECKQAMDLYLRNK